VVEIDRLYSSFSCHRKRKKKERERLADICLVVVQKRRSLVKEFRRAALVNNRPVSSWTKPFWDDQNKMRDMARRGGGVRIARRLYFERGDWPLPLQITAHWVIRTEGRQEYAVRIAAMTNTSRRLIKAKFSHPAQRKNCTFNVTWCSWAQGGRGPEESALGEARSEEEIKGACN